MNRFVILVFSFLLFYNFTFSQEKNEHLIWENSYKKALKKAKSEKKQVLIYFTGSDWCGPCIKLDRELFSSQKFIDLAKDNFVLYMADFPRNEDLVNENTRKVNKKLQKKFKQKSFPTLVFLNSRGREIARKKGYIITEYYYPFFYSILKDKK